MESVKGSASFKAMKLIKICEIYISDMEKLLITQLELQRQNCITFNIMMITAKAKSL